MGRKIKGILKDGKIKIIDGMAVIDCVKLPDIEDTLETISLLKLKYGDKKKTK